jgi:hypothetical protein
MGCHTWFYKKLNPQPTWDEIKSTVLEKYVRENIKSFKQMIDGTLDEELKKAYPEWNSDLGNKHLPLYLRWERIIEKNLCKIAVCNKYSDICIDLTDFHNGIFYKNSDGLPHDLFRIGGYPNDKLFSYDETITYIKQHHHEMAFTDDWEKNLKIFWDKYPDGMIDFG